MKDRPADFSGLLMVFSLSSSMSSASYCMLLSVGEVAAVKSIVGDENFGGVQKSLS